MNIANVHQDATTYLMTKENGLQNAFVSYSASFFFQQYFTSRLCWYNYNGTRFSVACIQTISYYFGMTIEPKKKMVKQMTCAGMYNIKIHRPNIHTLQKQIVKARFPFSKFIS